MTHNALLVMKLFYLMKTLEIQKNNLVFNYLFINYVKNKTGFSFSLL